MKGIRCKNCFKENFCGCGTYKRLNKGKLHWSWYQEMFEICGNCGSQLPYNESGIMRNE